MPSVPPPSLVKKKIALRAAASYSKMAEAKAQFWIEQLLGEKFPEPPVAARATHDRHRAASCMSGLSSGSGSRERRASGASSAGSGASSGGGSGGDSPGVLHHGKTRHRPSRSLASLQSVVSDIDLENGWPFGEALRDGVRLCRLANVLSPGAVPKIREPAALPGVGPERGGGGSAIFSSSLGSGGSPRNGGRRASGSGLGAFGAPGGGFGGDDGGGRRRSGSAQATAAGDEKRAAAAAHRGSSFSALSSSAGGAAARAFQEKENIRFFLVACRDVFKVHPTDCFETR